MNKGIVTGCSRNSSRDGFTPSPNMKVSNRVRQDSNIFRKPLIELHPCGNRVPRPSKILNNSYV